MDDDRDLLAELQEAIAQGPIIFTPDFINFALSFF